MAYMVGTGFLLRISLDNNWSLKVSVGKLGGIGSPIEPRTITFQIILPPLKPNLLHPANKKTFLQRKAKLIIRPTTIQTLTVGFGISPNQPVKACGL